MRMADMKERSRGNSRDEGTYVYLRMESCLQLGFSSTLSFSGGNFFVDTPRATLSYMPVNIGIVLLLEDVNAYRGVGNGKGEFSINDMRGRCV